MLQKFYDEFQQYKRDQDAVVRNLKYEFDVRLRSLEASMATTAHVLISINTRMNEMSIDTTCPNEFCEGISSYSSDTTFFQPEVQKEIQPTSPELLNSAQSQLSKWSPSACDKFCMDVDYSADDGRHPTSNIAEHNSVQDDSKLDRYYGCFEQLSGVLADMSQSLETERSCKMKVEPDLLKRMEVVCDDLHKAIELEREETSLNVSLSDKDICSLHHNCTTKYPASTAKRQGATSETRPRQHVACGVNIPTY